MTTPRPEELRDGITRLVFDVVLYALKDFLIKRLGSLLEHTT